VLVFQHRDYQQRDFQSVRLSEPGTLLALIDFQHPFQSKARPGAIVTGKLRLEFKVRGNFQERDFVLYNDELLEDLHNQDIFYNADSSLPELIERLLR